MSLTFCIMTGILGVMAVCVVYIIGKKIVRKLKSEEL